MPVVHNCIFDKLQKYRKAFILFAAAQDAEDITASVFQTLWLQRTSIDYSKPLRPWLYTVARNLCLNHIKSSNRRSAHETEALQLLYNGEENEFASHEFMEDLMREIDISLHHLPPQAAHIFKLAFFDGKSNQEIAALLNINEHTVRNQKSIALRQLRLSFRSWVFLFQFL